MEKNTGKHIPIQKSSGPLLVISAGICWGLVGVFSRPLGEAGLSSIQLAATRCAFTAIGLLVIILITNRSLLKIFCRDIWIFLCMGIFSIVLFNVFYLTAIKLTSLSIAAILLYTAPFFVLLISAIFFKERLTIRKSLALIMALAGCILTVANGNDGNLNIAGIIIGLSAGFTYSLYTIFSHIALAKYHPLTVTFYTFLIAAISLLPFSQPAAICSTILGNGNALINALLISYLATLPPFLLYTKGLQHMEASKASIIAFAEPLTATIAGIIFFHEQLTLISALGIVMIFAAITLLNTLKKDSPTIAIPGKD